MSTGPNKTAVKICGICGQDCSHMPRTKDTHGQYFCVGCYAVAVRRRTARRIHPAPGRIAGGSNRVDRGSRSPNLLDMGFENAMPVMAGPPGAGGVAPMAQGFFADRDWPTFGGFAAYCRGHLYELLDRPWLVFLLMLGTLVLLAAKATTSPGWQEPLIAYVVAVNVLAGLWGLRCAYREGLLCALAFLFVPFYGWYFVYGRSERPLLKVVTIVASVGGGVLAVF